MKTRVLLAGSCPLKNQGICSNLSTASDLTVIETTTELEQLPELHSYHQPDLLLVVLADWEESLTCVFHRLPSTNVLGLSPQNGQVCHTLIHQNVINGCLPETAPPEVLVQAIRAVASGQTWFSQALFKQILNPMPQTDINQPVLTNQELATLRLVMQEETNLQIAQTLNISERTVSNNLSAIYEKLGVVSKVGAALKAERLSLVED